MHVNTATNCRSQFTYGREDEFLVCERTVEDHEKFANLGKRSHRAEKFGTLWTWSDDEADK